MEEVKYSGGVRVTDLERTLVDSIKDMDNVSGIEEIISFIFWKHIIPTQELQMIFINFFRNISERANAIFQKMFPEIVASLSPQ